MIETTNAKCLQTTLGACSTHSCGIGQSSLVISTACTCGCGLQARISRARCETSAAVQSSLWLSSSAAVQASLLAPSKEACGLAILGGVLTVGGIALRAATGDSNLSSEAGVELAMIEAANAKCLQTTLGACSTHSCSIGQSSLVIGTACTCGCGLQARISRARCETGAAVQSSLWLSSSAAAH